MPALKRHDHYTTGQVAKICGVSPHTVSKWCNRGLLACWRIPHIRIDNCKGEDRRINREVLVAFMVERGIPLSRLPDSPVLSILCVGCRREVHLALCDQFNGRVASAPDILAGWATHRLHELAALVVDLGAGACFEMHQLVDAIDSLPMSQRPYLVLLLPEDETAIATANDHESLIARHGEFDPAALAVTLSERLTGR